MTEEDKKFLKNLQNELNTQTNDGNASPVYWGVMETKVEPAPVGCGGDPLIYIGDGETWTLEEAIKNIEEDVSEDGEYTEKKGDWDEFGYKDYIEEVCDFMSEELGYRDIEVVYVKEVEVLSRDTGCFLTKRACQEYIDRYGYNHNKPHTFAMTAFRNPELERLLNILKTIDINKL